MRFKRDIMLSEKNQAVKNMFPQIPREMRSNTANLLSRRKYLPCGRNLLHGVRVTCAEDIIEFTHTVKRNIFLGVIFVNCEPDPNSIIKSWKYQDLMGSLCLFYLQHDEPDQTTFVLVKCIVLWLTVITFHYLNNICSDLLTIYFSHTLLTRVWCVW